jgi:hypothetical protein
MSPVRSALLAAAAVLLLAGCNSAAPPATSRLLATIPPLPTVVLPTIPPPTATPAPTQGPTGTPQPTPTSVPATAPASGQPASGIAGDWDGTYRSTKFDGSHGTFTVTFTVDGSKVAGDVDIDSGCVGHGTIDGTVSGDAITFGVVKGAENIAFDGQLSGDSLNGSYTTGKGCSNDEGTWSATRNN